MREREEGRGEEVKGRKRRQGLGDARRKRTMMRKPRPPRRSFSPEASQAALRGDIKLASLMLGK